jgi:hypothetical protein
MKLLPLLCGLALFTAARADQTAPAPTPVPPPDTVEHPAKWSDLFNTSAISVISENDKYFAGTDRHYTNGFRLSFLGDTKINESPDLVQKIAEYVPTLNSQTAREQTYKVGVSLGQNIYTPADTEASAPITNDRPYAAWLYAALTFQAQSDDAKLLRVVEIAVGMVGPAALGREIQNGFHSIIGVDHANGWSNQLHNEPGINLSWERRYRVGKITTPIFGLQSDLMVRGGVTLGNIRTNAATGFSIRVGWQLPDDFGADLIRPAGGSVTDAKHYSLYLFGSTEGRAVARNIFLDGNTWQDSLSVDKRPLVADLNIGLVLRTPFSGTHLKGLQIAYIQNYRTKEFYGQVKGDVFGSIGVSFLF